MASNIVVIYDYIVRLLSPPLPYSVSEMRPFATDSVWRRPTKP